MKTTKKRWRILEFALFGAYMASVVGGSYIADSWLWQLCWTIALFSLYVIIFNWMREKQGHKAPFDFSVIRKRK